MNASEMASRVCSEVQRITFVKALGPTDSLLESGIVDSIGLVDLIYSLEDAFQVTIDWADANPANFETAEKIAAYIQARKS